MKNISRILVFMLFLLPLFICCTQNSDRFSEKDCSKSLNMASQNVNMFYTDSSLFHLDTALFYIEGVYGFCPSYQVQLTNLKLTALLLLKDSEKGIAFVTSLDSITFDKSYKKKMYLNTFKAFSYQKQGDTLKLQIAYQEIIKELNKYIFDNPSDKEALLDLYFTKVKLSGKESVLKEIDAFYANRVDDGFREALKESIANMPE